MITGISTSRARLEGPASSAPDGSTYRYGLGMPFQVSATHMALFCNLRREFAPAHDFEAGTDAVVFDDVSRAAESVPVPISRNHDETDPATGERYLMVKFPSCGGFVPHGIDHPFAGTGFGLIHAIGFPAEWLGSDTRRGWREPYYEFAEIQQYRFDGAAFKLARSDRYQPGAMPGGVTHSGTSFTAAIPDSGDLLFATQNREGNSGVARWRFSGGSWLPISFAAVAGAEKSFEPSLIRDVDGSFLFCARALDGEQVHTIRVWRSRDGHDWRRVVDARGIIGRAPVTLNQAADGTPYIAANAMRPGQETEVYRERGRLCVWPLSGDRRSLLAPLLVREGDDDFGPSPSGVGWNIDHPTGLTVRLRGGNLCHILSYRVADRGEVHAASAPTPVSGCHLMEVLSDGMPFVPWRFYV